MLLNLKKISIIDFGVNHSDHKPIYGFFDISLDLNIAKSGKTHLGQVIILTAYDGISHILMIIIMFREICSRILFIIQIGVIVITTCLHVDIINHNYRRIENGSPVSGYIHHIKCSTKLQYKMVLLNQDICTILNVVLKYNTKWFSLIRTYTPY